VKAEGLPGKWKFWDTPIIPLNAWLEILHSGLKKL